MVVQRGARRWAGFYRFHHVARCRDEGLSLTYRLDLVQRRRIGDLLASAARLVDHGFRTSRFRTSRFRTSRFSTSH